VVTVDSVIEGVHVEKGEQPARIPRGLFGNSGWMIAHSSSVSS